MANITVSLPSDGDTIDAADYNTPINTIVNEFNGNIDSTNLAANSVGASEIIDASITNAKLSTTAGEIGGEWLAYTSTVTGFSGTPTKVTKYSLCGKRCTIYAAISGTSNATTFTFSLPFATVNTFDTFGRVIDNTSTFTYGLIEAPAGTTANVYVNVGAAWTASGTKTLSGFHYTYEIA